MAAGYLVEVRTGGEIKHRLREISTDVAAEFGTATETDSRTVPHIPLYGRYETDRGETVKQTLVEICSDFDVVPYKVAGFEVSESGRTVSATVVPSVELFSLQTRIVERLRPLTGGQSDEIPGDSASFRIPLATSDYVADNRDSILTYLDRRYELDFDEYATRLTSIRDSEILWEYDLLQDRLMTHSEATSRGSWRQTESLLEERAGSADHDSLVTKHVQSLVEPLVRKGWKYFPDPHDHVTERARRDGLYRAEGSRRQRELYVGDDYVYLTLVAPQSADDIHVFSIRKSTLYDDTAKRECPVCGSWTPEYEDERVLPCKRCGLQYELTDGAPDRESLASESEVELCIRCGTPILSGGVQFSERVYCDDCVDLFEAIADGGVVVQS